MDELDGSILDDSLLEERISSIQRYDSKDGDYSLNYSYSEELEFLEDDIGLPINNKKGCNLDDKSVVSDGNIIQTSKKEAENKEKKGDIGKTSKPTTDSQEMSKKQAKSKEKDDVKVKKEGKEKTKQNAGENKDKSNKGKKLTERSDKEVKKENKGSKKKTNQAVSENKDNTKKERKITEKTDNRVKSENKEKNNKNVTKIKDISKRERKSTEKESKDSLTKDININKKKDNSTKEDFSSEGKTRENKDKIEQKNKLKASEDKINEETSEATNRSLVVSKGNEKDNQKNKTDIPKIKDKSVKAEQKRSPRPLPTKNTRKEVKSRPGRIVATLNKKKKGILKDGVYTELSSNEMSLLMKKDSFRESRTSFALLENTIMEESEDSSEERGDETMEETRSENGDEVMRSSSQLRPVQSVIITPRQQDGVSHTPYKIHKINDPRNANLSSEYEEDRISLKTDFYSPDLYSRDDVFDDLDEEDDINKSIPVKKKKKKKSKKQRKLEKKERSKRRRAQLLYEKIRGFCDSLYESESLTISIKRERKLRLDTYLPDREETRKYRIKRRKLMSLNKKVQQTLDTFKKKQVDIQENLKKLEGKKDKDAKPIMETLYEQLRETEQLYQQALAQLKDVQDDLGKKLGKKEEKSEPQGSGKSGAGSSASKHQLSPDEQELTYELKAQLMRNIEMQNQKLKTELTLHEKMNESKMLNQQNRKLHDESSMSRTNTLRLMKMFEKKAKAADEKLKEMQRELHKSQQLTKKYQQLLELEKRKMGGGSGHVTPVSVGDDGDSPRVPPPSSYSLLGGNVRVNDIIRKNEVLLEENSNLKREIQRLKQDNATLIKKTKHAMSDKDEIIKRIQTLYAENAKMQSQLAKERSQHNLLARSLTRQASDWIMLKKQLAQFDEEYKWSQVGPLNPTGAEERTYQHHAPKNVYMPRKMYPVENYAQANQSGT